MTEASGGEPLRVARVYLRVSSEDQDLARQEAIVAKTRDQGYYVAKVYREKASGARADRPELQMMIADLQPGEVVVAERIDRISRLPLREAEMLVKSIQDRGAKLAIPGVVDLTEIAGAATGVAKIVLDAMQKMLLRVALQISRDDYEERRRRQKEGVEQAKLAKRYRGRTANLALHEQIVALRAAGKTIAETAALANCSLSQVKRVCRMRREPPTASEPADECENDFSSDEPAATMTPWEKG